MRENLRNLDRMPTLSPTASRACQGLSLGLSVEHRGGAWEAWTLGQSGMVRMLIMAGWSGCVADPALPTRGVFDHL